ncbi:MAG TPA: diguanylate cyclase, partial [Deinococcales bacterium]|nr:diguanylate cyclase [Deinococcales bacterium]
PDEVLRSPTLALIDPADHATVLRAQERRSRNASDEYEVGVLRPDGTRLPVLVTAVPWLRDGEGVGSIAVLTDLSGRKATEAELAQRTLEAEALLEFSKMLEFQEDLESSAPAIIDVLARAVHLHAAGLAYRRDDGIEITVDWATEESKLRPGFHSRVPRGRGLTWLAFESGQPLYVDDYAAQAGASDHWLSLGLRSLAIIPIADGSLGDPVAFLAGRFAQAGPWLERERALLEAAGRSARAAIERYRRLREARRHALEDPLTSVGNRRAFDADLDAALAAAEAAGEPLSVLMVDLDNLKEMNDRFGHARGDLLLREFAGALKRSLRFDDSVYRFGGDEFAALLPRSPAAAQAAVMERLCVAVELVRAAGFPDFDVSAGVATFPEEGASGSAVVRIADQRLYQCKAEHRERRA